MSKDIRSFFTVISKKSGTDSKPTPVVASTSKKTKRIIDSDDEDVIPPTPEAKPKQVKKKKTTILSSDSEDEPPKKKEASNLKKVNVLDRFKQIPIKQSKVEPVKEKPKKPEDVKKSKKKLKTAEAAVHNDRAFEQTLLDDDDILLENVELLDRTIDEALERSEKELKENTRKINESKSESSKNKEGENKSEHDKKETKDHELKVETKKRRLSKSEEKAPPKKQKLEHVDSGIDPGQEAHEKRRYSAMLYQKYLNRTGPKMHGQKELPKGKPDCLKNLTFLRTGVLDSLEGEEFEDLVKRHGGRVVHGVSKKVNYIVVGDEPGPSKLEKARSYGIPNLSEDELLDLILTKSGKAAKYALKGDSSEDLGIESASESPKKAKKKKEDKAEENGGKGKETTSKYFSKTDESKRSSSAEKIKGKSTEKTQTKSSDETKSDKKSKIDKVSVEEKAEKLEAVQAKTTEKPKTVEAKTEKPKEEKVTTQEISEEQKKIQEDNLCLSEKYKPRDLKGIIGQQGDGGNVNKLKKWLQNWHRNQRPEVRKKLIKPSPWAKSDDGAYFKAALLSGSPGVGKTTTATLVAQDLGLDIVEFNASDTRSKKLLHQEVAQLLSTKTLSGYAHGRSDVNVKRVLLMDEVDGMAGTEDRGGMQELIQLIKTSAIPIICMCNDRNHQKMRSLVNYCYDLKFAKPKMEQIRGAMMSVCFKEGLKIQPDALGEIIAGTGCDVRQTFNHLAMHLAAGKRVSRDEAKKEAQTAKKDTVMGPWEVVRAVFTESEQKGMSLVDKSRLFFYDYSLGPLFVQENYLKVKPKGNDKEALRRAALAADSISRGDLIESKIRRSNNWSLLESQAMYSSVIPGHYMSGQFVGQINFPAWLGKNSKKNKFSRILSEIQTHTRTTASGSKLAVRLDYLVPLRNAIVQPLKKAGTDGVAEAVGVMKDYNLLREDFDGLIELCQWSKTFPNPFGSIDSKVKAAFTRTYNKQVSLLPYSSSTGFSKKKRADAEDNELGEEDEDDVDEEDDNVEKDAMIKIKKKPASKTKKDEDPSTSKKGATKGKGKKK